MTRTLIIFTVLFSLGIATAFANDAKVDLFEAGKDGYVLYRIPGIVVTKTGTVLAYCEARRGVGDWGPIDVMMRRSTDGGKTWLPRQKIVHVEGDLPLNPLARNLDRPGDNTVNNPVAIVDYETGAVHFLYCLEYMRCFYMRSDDDGATWTEPVEITKTFEDFRSDYDWKILATGPSHAIQLTHGPKRGRLVVPVWLSLGTGRNAHRPSVTATIYSDDHGKTWQRGDIAVPDTPEFINPNETVIVQLADGSVMLNSRNESKRHRRLVTISPDGATGWSEPRFDEQLLEPICMAGIVRVREPRGDKPGLIAFSNPHNLSRRAGPVSAGKNRDRTKVSIKLSDDEGKTWAANRTLEAGFSGYSDLAVLPDGTILCLYERGSTDGKNHFRTSLLTVARVTEDWVRDGGEADKAENLPGIVMDDGEAEYQGDWAESSNLPALVGSTYHHDGNKGRGEKSATFTATIPETGDYEIRLLYTWSENRSTRTTVTVTGAGEEKTLRINQREPAMKDRVPNALGIFRFEAGAKARVTVSNEGADGYVIVDALQILPAELAREERDGKRPSGYAAIEMVKRPTPVPVINAPRKPLKPDHPRAAAPADVHGNTYDLVIFGGTPGGIAMAVRAAREGLNVLLVNRNRHLGGILSSGLRVWDTLYEGKRSPIYDEARQGIFDYYRETYGERSAQYRRCLPGKSGHTNGLFEPAVAEHVLTRMVNAEPRITMLCDYFIADAERDNALLKTATFRHMQEKQRVTVSGKVFADCSYEGDLAAAAKVPYSVGRESREEFGEPHAGVVYMGRGSPQTDAERRQSEAHKKLNLRPFRGWQNVLPGSTGEGDSHVQAFNYRTVLTDDPANRLPVVRPDGYDRDFIAGLGKGSVVEIPNRKFGWNRPQVVGPHGDYVEGDWATRQRVMDEHWQATLGMLYFLQNDESVSPDIRKRWKTLGLAADEFPDNGHRPYEIYEREARRIVGRYVFTQHDGSLPADLDRAPIHPDSVGITEWYFDTHDCTKRRVPGSMDEGKMMLHESTFPGQVPYRALLPRDLDNLLVPVCISSTHVAWGTIRLEPTWMNLAESAAYAAGIAVKTGVSPSDIDSDALLRRLANARVMITFFNDIELGADDPRVPAAQYFGAKGFFSSYDARLDEPLTEGVRSVWEEGLSALRKGRLDPMTLARKVRQAEAADSGVVDFARNPKGQEFWRIPLQACTRGEAMLSMWRAIGGGKSASASSRSRTRESSESSPHTEVSRLQLRSERKCQPIQYSNPNLKTVPLPCLGAAFKFADWDGDGLLDLLWLSHPRYNDDGAADGRFKLYWLKNVATSASPLFDHFDKAELILDDWRLGRFFCLIDADGDGRVEVASVARKHSKVPSDAQGVLHLFANSGTADAPRWTVTVASNDADQPFRPGFQGPGGHDAVSLAAADLDGDGIDDLLLGTNHQDVMKHAFGVDPETHRPTAGRIYVARNQGNRDRPEFATPQSLATERGPIECFGFVYPLVVDADGDGRLELFVGGHQPGIRVFRQDESKDLAAFVSVGEIQVHDSARPGAEAFHLEAADLDGDGQPELIGSTYFGSLAFYERYSLTAVREATMWRSAGRLQMRVDANSPLSGPGISTPEPVDFDGDGDLDLLLGAEPGIPMWAENVGSDKQKRFTPPTRLKWIDGTPLETHSFRLGDGSHHGAWEWYGDRSAPRACDWDQDGVLDVISTTMGRRLYWLKGRPVDGEVRFERPQVFTLRGGLLRHPHRTLPAVVDWDEDGHLDVIGLDEASNLAVFIGNGTSDVTSKRSLKTTQGKPVCAALNIRNPDISNSRSGRSGIAAADWDGDGRLDLITHKHYFEGFVLFHRGTPDGRFEPPTKLFHFFSHLAGPSIVDWNGDGRLDILMGGDCRRMSGVMVSMPTNQRGHYFVYDGSTLPFPSARPKKRNDLSHSGIRQNSPSVQRSGTSGEVHYRMKPRPNVLFIPVDDLNDWLGVLKGHPQAKTPNFDRLAGRGTLLTRAYCTAPACNPSRKSVLTGTRPSTSGLYYSNKRIRDLLPGVVTLPEHFKHNGYRVEGGGKIFHSGMNDQQSWHAYFDQPRDPEPRKKPHVGIGLHQFWRWQPLEHFDDDDMADGKLVNWAAKFLKRDHDRPFFLGVGFYRPHMPWHVPKKYFDLFPLEDVQLPTTKAKDIDDLPGYGHWLARERTGFHVAAVEQNQWNLAVQAYLACIAFADAQLGRLLDALDASPHADNTIIVLWSDNGMHLGQKEHWTKWGLWEQATRVPLIVVAPGLTKPGARCDTPVSLLDLYPTLVELCDLPAVDRLEGESLVPLLKDSRAVRNTPAITTHGHMNHAIRTGRWRYIRYRDGSEELYDHRTDSQEWKNVAGKAEFQEELRGLRKLLPVVNVPDPPYLDRKQYWPDDPSPDDVSDNPGKCPEPADATQE